VELEEADQYHQLFAMFLYELKVARMEAREARRQQVETAMSLRQIDRDMAALVKETEPTSRASIRIAEEKCSTALVHVLTMERAVIRCHEELHRAIEMEHRRRMFLISFEEQEYKNMMKSGESAALWRPGMLCFGACPFVAADRHCPFRPDEELYGLHMDRSHFTSANNATTTTGCSLVVSKPLLAAPSSSSAAVDDVIGSIIRDGNPQRKTVASRNLSAVGSAHSSLAPRATSNVAPDIQSTFLASLVRSR
jgi:hypothetical protein